MDSFNKFFENLFSGVVNFYYMICMFTVFILHTFFCKNTKFLTKMVIILISALF